MKTGVVKGNSDKWSILISLARATCGMLLSGDMRFEAHDLSCSRRMNWETCHWDNTLTRPNMESAG